MKNEVCATPEEPVVTVQYDAAALRFLLPHRDIMALLDAVDEYAPVSRSLVASKLISSTQVGLQDLGNHFSMFPPTLLTECLAQTSGLIMNLEGLAEQGADVGLLTDSAYRATIPDVPLSVLAESHIRHESFAKPGEVVFLQSRVTMQRGKFRYFAVRAYTRERTLASGNILLTYPTYM